jgi:drug/metabolite transporter (DMT)-like permease
MRIAGGWRAQFVALAAIWGSSFLFIKVLDRHWPPTWVALGRVLAILVLGVLGTGVAYVLNYAILRAAGATTASTVTYVVPVFSTVLGAVVLGETVHWNQPVGAVVLLTGIAISQGRLRTRRPRPSVRSEAAR